MIRDELVTSRGELRESKEEPLAANGELRDKVELLDVARREASEAVNSAERLNEECLGLRGDLHQQITLVSQRDEVIGRLRDQASAQWASEWLAFQQKAANVYPGLDFNFDLPSDEEAKESFSVNYSQEPGTPAKSHSPFSPSVPPVDAKVPVLVSTCLMSTLYFSFHVYLFFFVGPGAQDICSLPFNKYSFFIVCVSTSAFCAFLHESYGLN